MWIPLEAAGSSSTGAVEMDEIEAEAQAWLERGAIGVGLSSGIYFESP